MHNNLPVRFVARGKVFPFSIACWGGKFQLALVFLNLVSGTLLAKEAEFYRAINLNGPALTIEQHPWEGSKEAINVVIHGSTFENQTVPLKPPTEPAMTQMIRSSIWGSKVSVEFTRVPEGAYQVFLYVWEDNQSERFDVLVNDQPVLEGFNSGSAGNWKKLGPWLAQTVQGKIKFSARGGAANLSGVEVWAGNGTIPVAGQKGFLTEITPEHTEFFERKIRPVLANQCYECHSRDAKKIKGGLLLDSRAGLMKGGDNGAAVVPGSPDSSLLIQAVKHTDPELSMPPKKKLSDTEIADLILWVQQGAPDPRTENTVAAVQSKSAIDWDKARQFWSLRPIRSPAPPSVKQANWPVQDLDRFILARLEKENLKPAADATKRVLIRRATFDLTGLPPSPKEIEAFLADRSPNAFAKVVDRLLDSPHYGERWGRYWLDVVRYADTAGDNSDFPIPQMYLYRNWVISAFNRDMPYDQFVRAQLAGDLLARSTIGEDRDQIIATGYIANARRFGSRVDDYPQHLTIEDTIDNLGRTFLGLTVNCARCHDHKFDPITAQDYYALYGIFNSTRYPWPGIELEQKQRDLVPLVPAEKAEAAKKEHAKKQRELEEAVTRLQKQLKAVEEPERKTLQKALDEAMKVADQHKRTPLAFEQAYAVTEAAKIGDAPVQFKGDPAKLGPVVPRHFLTVLGGNELPAAEKTSGRLQLAQWITEKDNPLTARVMVNRIWNYHFGKPIVPTPNDFGKQGKPPTHPELLDWLASRFMEGNWSIKSMHRLIMLSRTYQLSSEMSSEAKAQDPNNTMLSAFARHRLDAEAIRDSLLALGGNLEQAVGGPHPFPPQTEWKFTQHNPFKAIYETRQRSVYLMTQRIQRHPYLAIFDGADPAASTPLRTTSTTPLQALYFLNDAFVHEQAKLLASRILFENKDNMQRLNEAYHLTLGRLPESQEAEGALEFLRAVRRKLTEKETPVAKLDLEAWQAMVRVLFRLNEFVYVD